MATSKERLAFPLIDAPPFPPFKDYYFSEYPFSWHNREYTMRDLRFALQQSGLKIVQLDVFHHATADGLSVKTKLLRRIEQIGPSVWRPSIWAVAKKE